jgi:hypothetical protein
MTDRQLRSVCTTTLATLRWTKTSPGSRPTIWLAGTRESEQPIHRNSGRLQLGQLVEIVRVDFLHLVGPGAVEVEEVRQVFAADFLFRPVFQVEGEEHRAFDRRLVVGRRLGEAQFAVELHGHPHVGQRVDHQLAVADFLGRLDRRQRQRGADAVAAFLGFDVEALHLADAFAAGQRPDADTTGRSTINFGKKQAAIRVS